MTSSLDKIREHRNIVSFRNILVHGYDSIDDRIVWGIIEEDLGNLLEDVEGLIFSLDLDARYNQVARLTKEKSSDVRFQ
ncbi:MAG: DUF86 domain-containing protein [Candidatus Poribacteria bacterium]